MVGSNHTDAISVKWVVKSLGFLCHYFLALSTWLVVSSVVLEVVSIVSVAGQEDSAAEV